MQQWHSAIELSEVNPRENGLCREGILWVMVGAARIIMPPSLRVALGAALSSTTTYYQTALRTNTTGDWPQ